MTVRVIGTPTRDYDGEVDITLAADNLQIANLVDGESFTISQTAGVFDSRNAGERTVTVNLTAGDFEAVNDTRAQNYALPETATGAGEIERRTLVVEFAAPDKVYDGTNEATGATVESAQLIEGDTVSITVGSATFSDRNVGNNLIVRIENVSLSGADASNYILPSESESFTALAAITPRPLTITPDAQQSIMYGDRELPPLTFTTANLVAGDEGLITGALSSLVRLYDDTEGSADGVGGYAITLGNLNAGRNYTLDLQPEVLTVTPRPLTVRADVVNTVYGTPVNLGAIAATADGLINGDSVTTVSGQFSYNGNTFGSVIGSADAGSYEDSITASLAQGSGLNNYDITYAPSDAVIARADLTLRVIDDARFQIQSDAAGYQGVVGSGWRNGDTLNNLTGNLIITRTNANVNALGVYEGVLVGSGLNSNNYNITFEAGNYTIVSSGVIVKAGRSEAVYGSAPNYALTAQYSDGSTLFGGVGVSESNGQVTVTGIPGTSGTFTLAGVGAELSSSDNLRVGAYALRPEAPNFVGTINEVVVAGALEVVAKPIDAADLGIFEITKVYDGSINMQGVDIRADVDAGTILNGDQVSFTPSGSFESRHVGTGLFYSMDIVLTGVDAENYFLSGAEGLTGDDGVITQLDSVDWVGPDTGGSWSNPVNWAGGAIPDFSNVAVVNIPGGFSVVFDNLVQGEVIRGEEDEVIRTLSPTSLVNNGGTIIFNRSDVLEVVMDIADGIQFSTDADGEVVLNDDEEPVTVFSSGDITNRGSGTLILSGDNTYTGVTRLRAGSTTIVGSQSAFGSITTNEVGNHEGAVIADAGALLGQLDVMLDEEGNAQALLLNRLVVDGDVTLISDIRTSGDQFFLADVSLLPTGEFAERNTSTITLESAAGHISLLGGVDSAVDKLYSLHVLTESADKRITLGGSIGEGNGYVDGVADFARPFDVTIEAGRRVVDTDEDGNPIYAYDGDIWILADVLTANEQTYNGAVKIGNNGEVGFLYDYYTDLVVEQMNGEDHLKFDEYDYKVNLTPDLLDNDPLFARILISEDPRVTFNGTVDDLIENTHTLLVAAIGAPDIVATPRIEFMGDVGGTTALYGVNAATITTTEAFDDQTGVRERDFAGGVAVAEGVRVFALEQITFLGGAETNIQADVGFGLGNPNGRLELFLPTVDQLRQTVGENFDDVVEGLNNLFSTDSDPPGPLAPTQRVDWGNRSIDQGDSTIAIVGAGLVLGADSTEQSGGVRPQPETPETGDIDDPITSPGQDAQPPVTDDSVTAQPSAPRSTEASDVLRDLPVARTTEAFSLDADADSTSRGQLLVADVTAGAIRGLRESLVAEVSVTGFTSVLRFDQAVILPRGQAFEFEMPANTFIHSDPEALITYSARVAGGSALPAWVQFDASGLTFSGVAPEDVDQLRIELMAEDAEGNVATTFIELVFTP